MDLLKVVGQPTWREILMELIESREMDPWNIDIVEIADAYIKKIKNMQLQNLRIPANVILASALLVHFKAMALNFDEKIEEEMGTEEESIIEEELPALIFKNNTPRKRRVELEELIKAMEASMQLKPRYVSKIKTKPVKLTPPKRDLHQKMKEIYKEALQIADSENVLLFSSLVKTKSAEEIVTKITLLLHLVNEDKISIWQEKIWGEIFIRIINPIEKKDAKELVETVKILK